MKEHGHSEDAFQLDTDMRKALYVLKHGFRHDAFLPSWEEHTDIAMPAWFALQDPA
jgi:hypothetical protein